MSDIMWNFTRAVDVRSAIEILAGIAITLSILSIAAFSFFVFFFLPNLPSVVIFLMAAILSDTGAAAAAAVAAEATAVIKDTLMWTWPLLSLTRLIRLCIKNWSDESLSDEMEEERFFFLLLA